jgi:hypothetical protein
VVLFHRNSDGGLCKRWSVDYCRLIAFCHIPPTTRNEDVPLWLNTYDGNIPYFAVKRITDLHATDKVLAAWREDMLGISHNGSYN